MNDGLRHAAGMALLAGLLTFAFERGASFARTRFGQGRETPRGIVTLGGRPVAFDVRPSNGLLTIRAQDNSLVRDLDLALILDGQSHAIRVRAEEVRSRARDVFASQTVVAFGEGRVNVLTEWRIQPKSDALTITSTLVGEREPLPERVSLALSTPLDEPHAFIGGLGEVRDFVTVSRPFALLESSHLSVGLTATPHLGITMAAPEDGPLTARFTTPALTLDKKKPTTLEMRVAVASPSGIFGKIFAQARIPTEHVRGRVTGTHETARVFALDLDGNVLARVSTRADGTFEVDVPKHATQWYATLDATRSSAPVVFTPGMPWELVLDVSPGGRLALRVNDGDTGAPLTARIAIRGIDGTRDPNFGPDYRASGAGPIIDALRGEITTPMPSGRYRVMATRGIEWSIDAATVEILPGHTASATLAPRHVVPTPRHVGCDLHVHARPSFDTPVTVEDRVLSLVAAGVDFAVPSEHNLTGDYGPALTHLDLTSALSWVPGVEITTYGPRFGHFGLFPYPSGAIPAFRRTSAAALFAAAHKQDASRVLQVNHPRFPDGIGYFEVVGFDPDAPRLPGNMRTDFDALEVYNGYDLATPDRVALVLRDFYALLNRGFRHVATGSSDSHRIQFQWAGYPRTFAEVPEGPEGPMDVKAVVASIKQGRSFVSSGPVIELDVDGRTPGNDTSVTGNEVTAHLVVRAAPWIDATSATFVAGGNEVLTLPIPSRPTRTGPEPGTREQAEADTIRLDTRVRVPIREARWLMVVVRGTRKMDDVLPFMPVIPMAFTNPIWVSDHTH